MILPASWRRTQRYHYPPGLDHNLLFYAFRKLRPRDPIALFQLLEQRYGDAAHYKVGPEHIVLFLHPDYIREVLVVQNRNFEKERTVKRMKMLVGEGLITSEGNFHRGQRLIAQPAFHRDRIAGYADTVIRHAREMREEWQSGPKDIHAEMMRLALANVAKTLFDTDVKSELEHINHHVNTIMGLYQYLVAFPQAELFQHWPLPGMTRFRRARARLDEVVFRMIAEHRQNPERHDSRDGEDLLGLLLHAQYEDGTTMSDRQIRDEVMTIFLAGYETVANALTWTWYLLSENPEAEARLHQEVDQVLGSRPARIDDLRHLRYTEMVLTESMRLYPPAWAMGRRAVVDVEIGRYKLPRGTNVFLSQFITQRSEKYFDDPLRFDPERWTPEARASRPKFSYFPFGGGERLCIGESFAWMEGILSIATLAQHWQLKLLPGSRVEPQPLITLRPKYGMPMTLTRRT